MNTPFNNNNSQVKKKSFYQNKVKKKERLGKWYSWIDSLRNPVPKVEVQI